ncbi:MAG: hypothetical protein ACLS61_07575 [Ruminococcus sp.]
MIYVDEKYLTIAGKKIPGQVQSVTITEEGKIEDKKNSKGKVTKANRAHRVRGSQGRSINVLRGRRQLYSKGTDSVHPEVV